MCPPHPSYFKKYIHTHLKTQRKPEAPEIPEGIRAKPGAQGEAQTPGEKEGSCGVSASQVDAFFSLFLRTSSKFSECNNCRIFQTKRVMWLQVVSTLLQATSTCQWVAKAGVVSISHTDTIKTPPPCPPIPPQQPNVKYVFTAINQTPLPPESRPSPPYHPPPTHTLTHVPVHSLCPGVMIQCQISFFFLFFPFL